MRLLFRSLFALGIVITITLCGASKSNAQVFNVSLDLSGLTVGDTYQLDYQLNQGDASNGVSTVNMTSFVFGGGASADPVVSGTSPYYSGNATGDLSSTVNLNTSGGSAFNEFGQNVNYSGTGTVSFTVDATGLSTPGPGAAGADQFTFSLYDITAPGSVPSNGPNGFELFTVFKDPLGTYQTASYGYGAGNAFTPTINNITPAPELSTSVSFGLLLALLTAGMYAKRRRDLATGLARERDLTAIR